ncbi:MAG: metal ABC transporter ATP-binding protein [Lachnospiraceae bacterium]|nr:metal ABC transporter ATP-binding protein [Lachnospiraceae bacterium]
MRKMVRPCGLHCIKINHLGVTLGQQAILEDVNLHIHCGSMNVVIGRNGAGKSTLIRAILGDIKHTGNIEFKDRENGRIQKLKIGYVPQSLNVEKQTPVSVYDMIAAYQSNVPVFLMKSKKVKEEILEHLKIFEADYLLEKQVCNLSGGELQRVLLSMAVMNSPNLLLLDEPVSGIDKNGMELFYKTIYELKEHYDLAVILISHDLDYVRRYADKVILLDKTVLKQGSVKEVFQSEAFSKVFQTGGLREESWAESLKEHSEEMSAGRGGNSDG